MQIVRRDSVILSNSNLSRIAAADTALRLRIRYYFVITLIYFSILLFQSFIRTFGLRLRGAAE